jgi:hypothetical protein
MHQKKGRNLLLFLLMPTSLAVAFTVGGRVKSPDRTSKTVLQNNSNGGKWFVNEILDGLDTMMGVSPLSEADLKDDKNTPQNDFLMKRMKERQDVAPPSDALQKPAVIVFFALLGIIPTLLSIAALQAGVRPFNL